MSQESKLPYGLSKCGTLVVIKENNSTSGMAIIFEFVDKIDKPPTNF